ncbi:MAG: nucleoid occlusion protein [Oscillospiraceae bacterium]|nr:nucleoid occlusion protein [Oscillospiraceae bacterium]
MLAESIERSIGLSNVVSVFISNVKPNPYQPRREMDDEALEELGNSIRQYGLMQPIVVRQLGGGEYELIAGERRLRACKNNGMAEIPAVVMYANGTDSAVLALIENIQRENLNFMEEAEAFCAIITEHGLTQEELADRLGKNQSTVANKIRILRLSREVRKIIAEHGLTERHARALLRLPNDELRQKALKIITSRGLNVIKSEEVIDKLIEELNAPETPQSKNIRVFKDIRIFSNTIRQAVDMMKQAGIEATSVKNETDDYIEYVVKIPKCVG